MSDIENITFKKPTLEDGMSVFGLIKNCPPLDVNSSYCNLLQCSHFADTSVVAEMNGEIIGFISGYKIPEYPEILYVWQVAVSEQVRGLGIASKMLEHILARPSNGTIFFIETTITENNQASWSLFKGFANNKSANFQSVKWMDKDAHFAGQHDSEELVRIGPFNLGCL